MSSAPSVPGVEVGASWLGGCEQVLTAGALELLAALHRTLGPRRAEPPGSEASRSRHLADALDRPRQAVWHNIRTAALTC
jgi:hypothetical protein